MNLKSQKIVQLAKYEINNLIGGKKEGYDVLDHISSVSLAAPLVPGGAILS